MDLIDDARQETFLCCDEARAYALRSANGTRDRLESALAPYRAIAHPKRVQVVAALRELDELCVRDASVIADTSVALASHHLKALHEDGIVERRRDGKLTMYQLTHHGRALVDGLLDGVA